MPVQCKARRCYEIPSRQLKNDHEKIFRALRDIQISTTHLYIKPKLLPPALCSTSLLRRGRRHGKAGPPWPSRTPLQPTGTTSRGAGPSGRSRAHSRTECRGALQSRQNTLIIPIVLPQPCTPESFHLTTGGKWCKWYQQCKLKVCTEVASFPGRVGGERRPGIHCSRKRRIPRKTWEFVFVCKWSVKFIRIRPIHFRIIEKKQVRKRFLCV